MSIISQVGDFFRNMVGSDPSKVILKKFDILKPLLSTQELVAATKSLFDDFSRVSVLVDAIDGRGGDSKQLAAGVAAYRAYVKLLPTAQKQQEDRQPFSTIVSTLTACDKSLEEIQDHADRLFPEDKSADNLNVAAVVTAGFIEWSAQYATWVGYLINHLTAGPDTLIPPYQTQQMNDMIPDMSKFALGTVTAWSEGRGVLGAIDDLQKKGLNLNLSTHGQTIDTYSTDDDFDGLTQTSMKMGMRSPILMYSTHMAKKRQDQMDLLEARTNWMLSKIQFMAGKQQGMDEHSAEYQHISRTMENYATKISRYEKSLEKMRNG